MTTFYLDPVNGNDAADGSTFALGGLPTVGPWKTITSGATAARIAPGDVIRIAKSPDPTSLGQTAAWTNLSKTVTLQSGAVTLNIDLCETAWTASTSVTCTADTAQYKQGTYSAKNAIAAAFTTGKAAYKATGTLNLSAYQQISFWIRNSAAFTAGQLQIKLCSDTAGVTAVNTFNIPAIPSTNQWVPITLDNGSALGASIQSIALYVVTDFGAVDVYLDNIIACKAPSAADSLTLQSLISKNSAAQGGTEPWHPIQSINGTTILIDNHTNCLGNAGRGYSGTTETVTTYKRETIKTVMVASGTVQEPQDDGSATAFIEYQGGFNTSNNTQDGETFFDGLNGVGSGIEYSNHHFIKINYLAMIRYGTGHSNSGGSKRGCLLSNIRGIANTTRGCIVSDAAQGLDISGVNFVNNNGTDGVFTSAQIRISGTLYTYNNLSSGFNLGGILDGNVLIAQNNATSGIYCPTSGKISINSYTSANNVSESMKINNSAVVGIFIRKGNISESTVVTWGSSVIKTQISIGSWGGVATDNRTYFSNGSILSDTATRHTASGMDWKFSPTADSGMIIPLALKIAEIAVNANSQVTVSAWLRRTNAGITGSLVCRGGQLAGVASDVKTDMTAAANTWEQVTITFTPTEAGVVEIEAWAYGGTTYSVYVDDLSVSQA